MGFWSKHCGICLGVVVLQAAAMAQPASTQPISGIGGTIAAESEVPLSEMVIYLESPDPGRTFAPATQPAVVSQKEAQFAPRLLIVTVGQIVRFPNDEDRLIEHNVFSNSTAKRFDLGVYGPGVEKEVTFDKAGVVYLYCSIHRHMDGVIFVSPTPYGSRVGEDGSYHIENVPPGDWVMKTWQRRRRFKEQTIPVTVKENETVAIDMELKK